MASQVPGLATSLGDLAVALLSSSEIAPRARLIAQQVGEFIPGSAVVVYFLDRSGEPVWMPKATAGEVAYQETKIPFHHGTLGQIAATSEPQLFSGAQLAREDYGHLNVRRTLVSLLALPMLVNRDLVGAIEILSFDAPISQTVLPPLLEVARLGGLGLAAGATYEAERNASLESITRLTQLYDVEKVLNSVLEMDALMLLIASKFQELLNVQAVNLWMVDADGVRLMSRAGKDNTVELDTFQRGGTLVGDIADKGESVLIESAADERLQKRNQGVEEAGIFSYIAAPLLHGGAEVGVVEAINKLDGTPFDEDDLFFLTTLNETAANALHNASLLEAERKVEILQTLVGVSQQITSTLDLDRVMQSIVNDPQAVIPYERAAIGLEQSNNLKVRAVSGMKDLRPGDVEVDRLTDMLQWASLLTGDFYIRQHGDDVENEREETRAKFRKYFSETGMRGFYCLPLADDTGRLGLLSFESSDPDFLTPAHIEMIKVLAGQATVALRNAQMYKEVPFIGLLEPVLHKKRKFMAMEKHKRALTAAIAAGVVLFLAFFPLPMRVDGDATVAPAHTAQVMPEVEGVVSKVYVLEGSPVAAGTVLADLEDWEYRSALAAAEAKYNDALSATNRALASNDGTEAGIQRVQADYWRAEVERARERLDKTHLRSPISGVVATPQVENFTGKHLRFGDSFAEVVDSSHATIDVAVDEQDAALLAAGQRAAVKLDGLPARTLKGDVTVVSPKAEAQGDHRVLFARVAVINPEGALRPGMQGRGKVSVGWHAAGYVLLRRAAMWSYAKLWSWFGW